MEKTLSSRVVFRGKIITVRVDEVELQDGSTSKREVVEHSGAVAVLAVDDEKNVLFVRQYRKPVEQELLEIPAGKLEPGEAPEECARRELQEEAGVLPEKLVLLAEYYSSPGFASERLYVYLAGGLSAGTLQRPADEFLTVIKMPYEEALKKAKNGEIRDGKTLIALLLAQDRLR